MNHNSHKNIFYFLGVLCAVCLLAALPELLDTEWGASYVVHADSADESESPTPTPSPSPTPDPKKDPKSIRANYIGPTLVPGAKLNESHFEVYSYYEGDGEYRVSGYTISPAEIKRAGKQDITIALKVNGKTYTTKVEVEVKAVEDVQGFTISFNVNGGNGILPITDIIPFSRQEVPTPTRTGYWFRGWFTDTKFTTPFLSGDYVYSNLILNAKWEKKENYGKDTITQVLTDDTYEVTACVDFEDQDYDHTVSFSAVGINRKSLKRLVETIAETDLYVGANLSIDGVNFSPKQPIPVNLTVPENFDISATHIYLTTNLTSVMAEMPTTVSGQSLSFDAYQDGAYIILNIPTQQQEEEAKVPHIEIKCKKYQIAVGRETQLTVSLIDFSPEEKATSKVKWVCKNPKRAKVDEKGWVTGLKKGKIKIRCKVTTDVDDYAKTIKMEILP